MPGAESHPGTHALRPFLVVVLAVLAATATVPRLAMGWLPFDDGYYAWVADQLLRGADLHAQILSFHLGYQHHLHAWLFEAFGSSYLSLRFMLPVLTGLSACAAMLLLRPLGWVFQVAAACTSVGFGFLLFTDPSANWTCLTLFLWAAWWLRQPASPRILNDVLAGIAIGFCIGLRHPSGVILGMAAACCVLLSAPRGKPRAWTSLCGCLLGASVLLGLLAYWWLGTRSLGAAIWMAPATLIAAMALKQGIRADATWVARRLLCQGAGAILALLPLALVAWSQGSWTSIFDGLRTSTLAGRVYSEERQLDFALLGSELIEAAGRIDGIGTLLAVTIAALLLASPVLLAVGIGRAPWRSTAPGIPSISGAAVDPLVVVAAFSLLVVIYLPTWVYVGYAALPTMLALLWLAGHLKRTPAVTGLVACLISSATSFTVMSSQLAGGGSMHFMGVERMEWVDCPLPRCNIKVSARDARDFKLLDDSLREMNLEGATLYGVPYGYHLLYGYAPEQTSRSAYTRFSLVDDPEGDRLLVEILGSPCPLVVVDNAAVVDRPLDRKLGNRLGRYLPMVAATPRFTILGPGAACRSGSRTGRKDDPVDRQPDRTEAVHNPIQ